MDDKPKGGHNKNIWIYVLVGGVILYALASKSSSSGASSGGATASQIIAQNTAINADAVQQTLGLAQSATTYAVAKTNADSAVRLATQNGATATEIQRLVTDGNIAVAQAQSTEAQNIAKTVADATVATAASQYNAATQISQYTSQAGIQESQNAANAAVAAATANANAATAVSANQASASKTASNDSLWGKIVGGITSIIGGFSNPASGGFPTPNLSITDLSNLIPNNGVPSVTVPNLPPIGSVPGIGG